jgi:type II secretory pathway pseudopilin PulG
MQKSCAESAFSLVETVAALTILAILSVSILVVINRCMASAANSTIQMQAFVIARDNMEKLLAYESVKEGVEYGVSEKYPDI